MKNFNQTFLALILLAFAGTATATVIKGSIAFGTAVGASWTPTDSSLTTATTADLADGVVFNANGSGFEGIVTSGFSDYAGTAGTNVDFTSFAFNPLAAGSTLWSFVSGASTYSFVMDSVQIVTQTSSQIGLKGSGTASITGFTDTGGNWDLTLNASGSAFSFSSGVNVPEPGIALLLSIGLIGFGVSRKLRKTA